MHEFIYLICLKTPFIEQPYLLIKINDEIKVETNIAYILKFKIIIAYDFDIIVENFRTSSRKINITIYDVKTAIKLLTGKSKSDINVRDDPWGLNRVVGKYANPTTLSWLNKFNKLKIPSIDFSSDREILEDLINSLEKAWQEIEEGLKSKDEAKRYYDIEVPIYNIFLKTQLNGILIDKNKLNKRLDLLKTIRYLSYKKLEFEYDFISQKITYNLQWNNIAKHVPFDCTFDYSKNIWKTLDLFVDQNEFIRTLVSAHKSKHDYNALIKYTIDDQQRIYPRFDIMGTVTGRILVISPGIQYLKKTSRDIFLPQGGCQFIYADFSQFEPGIVASFSEDEELLKIYNRGDIYTELGNFLFPYQKEYNRKLAKVIFLSFIYGMSKKRLIDIISKVANQDVQENVIKFFKQFSRLIQWKDEVCHQALEKGFSVSFKGNKRYILKKGELSNKEKRWIPNQIVQGTSSYILKKSILSFHEKHPDALIVIPMHDAVLIEVQESKINSIKSDIYDIFCHEFSKVCPNIKTNIDFEDFYDDDLFGFRESN